MAKYVERNALRGKLVERAEEWRWSNAYRLANEDDMLVDFLSPLPMERPAHWLR